MAETDTEDPNIATLRTFLGYHLRGHQSAALSDARQAISALAFTLAERDRRIAWLTRELNAAKDKTRVIAGRLLNGGDDKAMTTQKRYEEMAEALYGIHRYGFGVPRKPREQAVATMAEALRTAAREAQARVLDLVKRSPRSDYCETSRVLDDLRARIDSGEDL